MITRVAGADLRRSLRMVIVGIAFGMVFFAVTTGSPLSGYARMLGAGDLLYGVLMALPVAGGVFQLLTAYWLERLRRRKGVFLVSLILQRLIWIPLAFVPFFVPAGWPGLRVWIVIFLLCLSSIGGAVGTVPFLSWMGDLVPDQIRGRYFSLRSTISAVTGCLGGLAAGWFLDLNSNMLGFAVVFTAAALFGVADIICFFWVDEPPMQQGESVSFLRLLAYPFRHPNFRRYMVFWAFWLFGINVAGPFFNLYMLEHLRLGYLQISLYTQLISTFSTVLFLRFWGRLADRYGAKPVMSICCTVVAAIPICWLLATPLTAVPVVIGINILVGIFWSGMDVTYLNLLLRFSPDRSRSMYMAAFNLFTAMIGNALAALAGGLFLDLTAQIVNRLSWHIFGFPFTNYHLLFILSTLLRGLALIVFFPAILERTVETGFLRPGKRRSLIAGGSG